MMYTQSLEHIQTNTMDELVNVIETKLKPQKYACILHDKDIDEKGSFVNPHVHLMMTFKNARSIANIAKLLNDKPQYIEMWKGNANNGFAYLTHRTKQSRTKHQYDPNLVKSNFIYQAELDKIREDVMNSKQILSVSVLLDAFYDGSISKEEIENKLTGSQYSRTKRQIDDIWSKRMQKQAEIWRAKMIAAGEEIKVIWIFGTAGVGKTSFAKDYAEKTNRPYYLSGSSRDIFQNYAGEHTLILDEFRPSVLPYQDLLRILDPFGEQVMAPSRYHDKALSCDLIIITSPYDPLEFYNVIFGKPSTHTKNKIQVDSFDQLLRRLMLIIKMDNHWICAMEFNRKNYNFAALPNAKKKNPFSNINRPETSPLNKVDLFNKMFN
ncbi:Rep family protein [Acetobacterium carbinolicum]|uniref:Rep family protein n=1 Tax=Acetobacterium carbinolicum TaxID=52690 RepID=UPI0039BED1F0